MVLRLVSTLVPDRERSEEAVERALRRVASLVGAAGVDALGAGAPVPILHGRTIEPLDLAVWADLVLRTIRRRTGGLPPAQRHGLVAQAGAVQLLVCLLARGGAVEVDGAPGVLPMTRGTDGSLVPVLMGRPILSQAEAETLSGTVPRETLVETPVDVRDVH